MPARFEDHLDLESLKTPFEIQEFLDSLPYSPEERNRCPLSVLRERKAHCLDGALFAAAALRYIGHPPLLVDMFPEPGSDDDHVLALYRFEGHYGAVAKSNFSGLRFREPVYRSLRELVMSYFEPFFNRYGQKTLRSYTRPLRLERLDRLGWMWADSGADVVERRLLGLKRIPLLSKGMIAALSPVDRRSYEAGMHGVLEEGLYKPK